MNPPYSDPVPWLNMAIEQAELGKTVVVLLRVDTSTNWFHDLVLPRAEVRFVRVASSSLVDIFNPERGAARGSPALISFVGRV